jgi:4-hydroxybenzoate polyprenyltransferase
VSYSYALIWVLWGLWGMYLAWPFYIAWLVLGYSYYQQVQDINRTEYFKAFLRNQSAGCWVFLGICLSQMWSS